MTRTHHCLARPSPPERPGLGTSWEVTRPNQYEPVTEDELAEIRRLHAEGMGGIEIARTIG
ncbi:hypothetical protein [Streptomyces avermitilis]|uniref:hypothetical protein n=1 Tax=Streptomyces avermitilis TaxID=33903 RepID=UPI00380FFF63